MNSIRRLAKGIVRTPRKIAYQLRFKNALRHYRASDRILYLMGLGHKHPNLGDQAQAAAIPLWLGKHFKRQVIQVKTHELEHGKWNLKALADKSDIIFMHSGGNFGDDWYPTQQLRETIVTDLCDNAIIQLPQTIHFSAGIEGKQRLAHSQMVFGSCKRLMLFGRDRKSAELGAQYFPNLQVRAKPDMVLSLQAYVEENHPQIFRSEIPRAARVLLIMRNDKEGIFSQRDKTDLLAAIRSAGYISELWDTDVKEAFPEEEKLPIVMRYLEYIASFDAVITDRYHGLIFSVLAKRPCVVLPTHNHKLTSAFDWFESVNFVTRTAAAVDVIPALKQLDDIRELHAPDWNARYFDPMAEEVKTFLHAAMKWE